NMGDDRRYEGELNAKAAGATVNRGELIAWNPVERRSVWRVTLPVLQSGGVLATAGNLVFQGRADGHFIAYRATDGASLWDFDAGTGIMAPPVTYLARGVQYVTVMVGWGGSPGLINPPGEGPVKPGFGRILTFALGGKAPLRVQPYGHPMPPSPPLAVTAS